MCVLVLKERRLTKMIVIFGRMCCAFIIASLLSGCAALTAAPGVNAGLEKRTSTRLTRLNGAISQSDLLYATGAHGNIYVFSFPKLKLLSTLPGNVVGQAGLCVDAAGDIFVPTGGGSGSTIYEYAHGGTTPIAALPDPGIPYGCSVDAKTGDLAVANVSDPSNPYNKNYGDVAVYSNAQGDPEMYYNSKFAGFGFCGYDNGGTLYVTGFSPGSQGEAQLLALTPGGPLEQLMLDRKLIWNNILQVPSVQWDGRRMTVSTVSDASGPVSVYRLKITGLSAHVVSTVSLSSPRNLHFGQTWISGGRIVGIYNYRGHSYIGLWRYPSGGTPETHVKVSRSTNQVIGVALSPGAT